MAKKKTKQKQPSPQVYPQDYQFGGLNTFLKPFTDLTNKWSNFWDKGGNAGDYFKVKADPYTYDPTKPTVNDPFGGNELARTVAMNNNALSDWQGNKKTLADNSGFTGKWGPEAHDYYYNKTLNGAYTESELSGFAGYKQGNFSGKPQEATAYAVENNIDLNKYNAWNKGRDAYANTAGSMYDTEASKRKTALGLQSGYDKAMTDAVGNTFSGILSGLEHQNSWTPPEEINLQQGSKGIMYQDGGYVKGPGMKMSPMMADFGAIQPQNSSWAHFPSGNHAIDAIDSLLFSGRSKYYTPKTKVAEALSKYSGGDYSNHKYAKKTLGSLNANEKTELLNDIIKKEVTADNYNTNYAGAITGRQIGPSMMDYQVTSRQDGGNIGTSLLNYQVTSENPNKTISAFEGTIADKINFNGVGNPLKSEFEIVIDNNDILEALVGMQGIPKRGLKNISKNKLIDLLKVNSKHLISTAAQQGVQETVGSWQYGGNMNMTGYTPGTPTMQNDINEIPSGDITMEQTPIPLLAIGKGGADNGLLKVLQPQSKGYNFKSKSTVEIPLEQQQPNSEMAKYGKLIKALETYQKGGLNLAANFKEQEAKNMRSRYEAGILAGVKGPGLVPTSAASNPVFGNNAATQMNEFGNFADQYINTQPPKEMMYPQRAIGDLGGLHSEFQQAIDNSKSVYSQVKDPYEYKSVNGKWQTRKRGIGAWKEVTDPTMASAINKHLEEGNNKGINISAEGTFGKSSAKTKSANTKGVYNPASIMQSQNVVNEFNSLSDSYKPAGINPIASAETSIGNVGLNTPPNNSVFTTNHPTGYDFQVTDQNPTNNSQSAAPVSYFKQKGLPYQETPDQVYLNNMNAVNANMGVSGGGLWLTTLPKVGKVIQYGSKYIDKAGNYVSKSGTKLSKVSDAVMRKINKDLYKLKATPDTWDDIINAGLDIPRFTNATNYAPGVRTAWAPVPKQYGGVIPHFRFGGAINDEHAIPVFSSHLEEFGLTELQTEKGEIAFMPDGSLPDVKAKELHKNQDKDDVSDIMQSGTYIFSNDPKMKFGIKSRIGGVELGDMKLGKSVFKYKENEITPGPEDIMIKDMFFNGSKKELTTADIAKNVKKNLPLTDQKSDYYADRAIEENKEQRVEYLSILKAFNEFKKPKPRGAKAQYGMPIQPTQNGLDGVMGYGDKQMDPFKRMDNNMLSMFNYKQPPLPTLPKMYEDGGSIEHAQLGKLLYNITGKGFGFGAMAENRAEDEQRRRNEILRREAQGYRDDLQNTVDTSGRIGVGTNMATYAAALNVPLQRYDDQSEQMAMYNSAANRAVQQLEASKYTASQGIGGASSLARYTNPGNYGDYLSKVQSDSNNNIGKINNAISQLNMERAQANIGFVSTRNAGRNQSLNARDTQLYNANVQGIGNVGKSVQESLYNSGATRYQMGNEKMAYDSYLLDKQNAARQKVTQDWEGSLDAAGQIGLMAATGGFSGMGGGQKTPSGATIPTTASITQGQQMSPIGQRFNYDFGFNNGFAPATVINPLQSMGVLNSNRYAPQPPRYIDPTQSTYW